MLLEHPSTDQTMSEMDRDGINIAAIWQTLAQHFRQIAMITICTVLLGLFSILFSHPQFVSVGSLYTVGLKPSGPLAGDMPDASASSYMSYLSTFQPVSNTQTQVDILTSPVLVQEAILATGLNVSITGPKIRSPRYGIWQLFYGGSVAVYAQDNSLQALDATFFDASIIEQKYKVSFGPNGHYIISQNGKQILQGTLNQRASGGGLSLLLQTPNGAPKPSEGSDYNLKVTTPEVTAEALLRGPLSVVPAGTPAEPSEVVNIYLNWSNPYQAKAFVDQLMSTYIGASVAQNSSAASNMETFIAGQLKDVTTQLAVANQRLAAYQQQTGLISPPDNTKIAVDQEAQFESARAQFQNQVVGLRRILSTLNNSDPGIDPYLLSQVAGTPLSALSEKLAQDGAALKELQLQYSGGTSQVQAQSARIAEEQDAIRSMVENELSDTQTKLSGVNVQIAQSHAQIGAMPAESLQVNRLTRSSEALGNLYGLLMQKKQEASLSKAAAVSATHILTPGQLPLNASKPKATTTLALAAAVGLMFGSGWILIRRVISGRLNTELEIRGLIKSRVFATIPQRLEVQAKSTFSSNQERFFTESLRLLRRNIYLAFSDQKPKVILLTSASSGEGKSMIALNLARSLARDGKRVVLVDADPWTVDIHKALGLTKSHTSNWLVKDQPVVLQIPDGQGFSVLTTSLDSSDADEVFSDANISNVLAYLSANHDFIIVDSPTQPHLADLLVLASHADLILSVVRIGVSARRIVAVHQDILAPMKAHRGLIINGIAA
jgi:tyrosine-protein kinase Etk/Wzc